MIYLCKGGTTFYDESLVPEELKDDAIVVNELPLAEETEGYQPILKFDTDTKKIWYEYIKIEKTPEEKIQELENALLEMSTLQAIKDIENEQAIMELTNLIGGMM